MLHEVEHIIKNLKNNKAAGQDGITNQQLKFGGKTLLTKITNYFNEILNKQTIPKEFKQADIILIHKKGDKGDINNYRPITLSTA